MEYGVKKRKAFLFIYVGTFLVPCALQATKWQKMVQCSKNAAKISGATSKAGGQPISKTMPGFSMKFWGNIPVEQREYISSNNNINGIHDDVPCFEKTPFKQSSVFTNLNKDAKQVAEKQEIKASSKEIFGKALVCTGMVPAQAIAAGLNSCAPICSKKMGIECGVTGKDVCDTWQLSRQTWKDLWRHEDLAPMREKMQAIKMYGKWTIGVAATTLAMRKLCAEIIKKMFWL